MIENKEVHLKALREIFGKERVLHEPVDCFATATTPRRKPSILTKHQTSSARPTQPPKSPPS